MALVGGLTLGGLVALLILTALFLFIAYLIINKVMDLLFNIDPTIKVTANPTALNDTTRATSVTVNITLPKTLRKPITIKGRLWEDDVFGDDHLQTFDMRIPAAATTSSATFTLDVVNTGNEEILNGNRGYSGAEDEWKIYAETEKNGRVLEATSNTVSLFWTSP